MLLIYYVASRDYIKKYHVTLLVKAHYFYSPLCQTCWKKGHLKEEIEKF